MSKYDIRPIDFTHLKTVPLAVRGGKVRVDDFATAYAKGAGIAGWLDSLPKILAGEAFRSVVEALAKARAVKSAWISLSHTDHHAVAMIALES